MKPKHQRLAFILCSMAFLAAAVLFTLQAFRENIVFFYTPSELLANPPGGNAKLRLGGLVEGGSVLKGEGQQVRFAITDGAAQVEVRYTGMLPNLFREGQGVVAEGGLAEDGHFAATSILAKHDETYMPREVVESLKANGRWKGEGQPRP